jgi:hypothetical protein
MPGKAGRGGGSTKEYRQRLKKLSYPRQPPSTLQERLILKKPVFQTQSCRR